MAFAALHLPDFPLQALLRHEPALQGRPVALITGEGRDTTILHATPEASSVTPGLPAPLALSRCPGLELLHRHLGHETETQRLLLASAWLLSPRVENTRAGLCCVDLQGADPERTRNSALAAIAHAKTLGLHLCIGISTTPFVAELAAGQASPFLEVEAAGPFLRNLPLASATPSRRHAELLAKWGVRTLGDLQDLPKGDVAQRLGPEGLELWERAAGIATRLLRLVEPTRTFAASWNCEPPVETIEPLLFRLQRFAERLSAELRASCFVASSLSLTLHLEDESAQQRDFRLPEPSGDAAAWVRILHSHLTTVRTESRITGIHLVATPVRPPQKQEGLFDTGLRDPMAFWETLARVAAIVGNDRVGMPCLENTHRPEAFHLERPPETIPPLDTPLVHPPCGLVLRRFRPSHPVQVLLLEGKPAEILRDRQHEQIRNTLGPWLSSGNWWEPAAHWTNETWHVQLQDQGWYQLTRTPSGWQVEGLLD